MTEQTADNDESACVSVESVLHATDSAVITLVRTGVATPTRSARVSMGLRGRALAEDHSPTHRQ